MYLLELQDLMFLIKCMQDPSDNFEINSYISISSSCTRASSSAKLNHNFCHYSITRYFYTNRIARLWNALPSVEIFQSYKSLKHQITTFLWDHFIAIFNPDFPCTFHFICPCSSCHHIPHLWFISSYSCTCTHYLYLRSSPLWWYWLSTHHWPLYHHHLLSLLPESCVVKLIIIIVIIIITSWDPFTNGSIIHSALNDPYCFGRYT